MLSTRAPVAEVKRTLPAPAGLRPSIPSSQFTTRHADCHAQTLVPGGQCNFMHIMKPTQDLCDKLKYRPLIHRVQPGGRTQYERGGRDSDRGRSPRRDSRREDDARRDSRRRDRDRDGYRNDHQDTRRRDTERRSERREERRSERRSGERREERRSERRERSTVEGEAVGDAKPKDGARDRSESDEEELLQF